MNRIFCVIIVSMFYLYVSAQPVVYISPEGNDTSHGSIEKPFRTLEKALQVIGEEGILYVPRAGEILFRRKLFKG